MGTFKEYAQFFDMVQFDQENSTQCAVYDKTPGAEQRKINMVVRRNYTVGKVMRDITTQFHYDTFDLVFQPKTDNDDLVYLNDCQSSLLYDVSGFQPDIKNNLVLLPSGGWDGNTKKRYDLTIGLLRCVALGDSTHANPDDNTDDNIVYDVPTAMAATNNTPSAANSLNSSPNTDSDPLSDDELVLGASASPTEPEGTNGCTMPSDRCSPTNSSIKFGPMPDDVYSKVSTYTTFDRYYTSKPDRKYLMSSAPMATNAYVGLVNQAMTCYLNSLLQALYMTPEFRNALYRWEFDNDNEAKNIPYQLQKLFLNLQTSKKPAVETTDLTRSFGWDSTEAWNQHDIQELCRVMFDALERKFRNTKQANLISNLYEGKMIDYVKCLECNTEKIRADTFLDIPLPVRPFGRPIPYGSIEEALCGFVQPETLNENNQYFCEKCNKKCDAYKGLKFTNFPYILTLHLKRFDFDYQCMHRIKLNDKVTFPQTLNLNMFINNADEQTFLNEQSNSFATPTAAGTVTAGGVHTTANGYIVNGVANTTTDDCSTTDSGSAMEEDNCSSGIPTTACSSQHENEMQDDDEGIDMGSNTITSSDGDQHSKLDECSSGPFIYELFAIMIHSGSATGGHYYAYIKEFENNEWFCFNDQTVSPITEEDIEKTFGGGVTKAYYSSVYSSSTNAYMLMYRQMDAKRNEQVMKSADFPEHIHQLLTRLNTEEDGSRRRRSGRYAFSELALPELSKQRVYFYNPQMKKLKVTRVYVGHSFNLDVLLESAHLMLNVDHFAPINRCRIVGYDASSDEILQSFENINGSTLEKVRATCHGRLDFLLEYRAESQNFEIYQPGGSTWYVYMVNLSTMEMDGPYLIYSAAHEYGSVLRHSIAVRLHLDENELLLATLPCKKAFVAYNPNPTKEAEMHLQNVAKMQFRNLTHIFLNAPNIDEGMLEVLGIPVLDAQTPPSIQISDGDEVDAALMNCENGCRLGAGDNSSTTPTNGCLSATEYSRHESPLLPVAGHESNSEDSSISDGDRTLVESLHNRSSIGNGGGGDDSQISSTSHSPQLSSSEEDQATHDSAAINRINAFFNSSMPSCCVEYLSLDLASDATPNQPKRPQFFHAMKIDEPNCEPASTINGIFIERDTDLPPKLTYKVIVDSHMKVEDFKRRIEQLLQVPSNYFKITRRHDSAESINLTQNMFSFNEGETLMIELGKVLLSDEYKAKIFYMRLSELDNDTDKLPCAFEIVFKSDMTCADAKKTIIAQLQRLDDKYESLRIENCRLWLKSCRNPFKILRDEESLDGSMRVSFRNELYVQECEDGIDPRSGDDTLTLFLRQWHPDTLQLGKFEEITLKRGDEIRATIMKLSNIPEDRIGYSKINSSFPCTNISLLNISSAINWFTIPATIETYPLTNSSDGNMYFYKDMTVTPKELNVEERHAFTAKEKARLDRMSCVPSSSYSPRRERGLKIYLDTSPQAPPAMTPMDTTIVKPN